MDEKKFVILKYALIVIVILSINLIGGYFIAKKILNFTYNTKDMVEELNPEEQDVSEDNEESTKPGIMRSLDAINLNPADSSGEIFSCDIVLEAQGQSVIDELEIRDAQILDRLSTYLAYKTIQELSDAKQWDKYRKEMIEIINSVLTDGKISNLYIKQKIIQFE